VVFQCSRPTPLVVPTAVIVFKVFQGKIHLLHPMLISVDKNVDNIHRNLIAIYSNFNGLYLSCKSSSGHHHLHSNTCYTSITAIYRPRFTHPLRLKLGQYTHAELHRAYAAANGEFDLQLKLMDNSLSTPNLPDVILDGLDR
jgi:hypothetical protein